MKRPYWDHAGTHYMCVSEQLIDKLQRNYFAGRDLARSIPSLDADTAAVIVAETLEADYCWSVLVDGVKNQRRISIDPLNDWSRATTAYFFFRLMEIAKGKGDKEHQEEWRGIGESLLDEIVRSPTASQRRNDA